jgi:hypothetical protein
VQVASIDTRLAEFGSEVNDMLHIDAKDECTATISRSVKPRPHDQSVDWRDVSERGQ